MDLGTLAGRTRAGYYTFLWQFVYDASLIVSNCVLFHGSEPANAGIIACAKEIPNELAIALSQILSRPVSTTTFDAIARGEGRHLKLPAYPEVDILVGLLTYIEKDKLAPIVKELAEITGAEPQDDVIEINILGLTQAQYLELKEKALDIAAVPGHRGGRIAALHGYLVDAAKSYVSSLESEEDSEM